MSRWLKLAYEFDSENLIPLDSVEILSDNGISIVMRHEDYIYKRSIPFLIENEIWMLKHMWKSGFVPAAKRVDKYTISMVDFGVSEPVTNFFELNEYVMKLKSVLQHYEIRHGDITPPNIIVKNNAPCLLDWAEARLANDPRPSKRPGGDEYWIDKTWKEIADG